MATVNLRVSPALKSDLDQLPEKNLNGSLRTVYKFIRSPQQQRILKSTVKSMKIVEQVQESACRKFSVRASDVEIGAISPPVVEIGVSVFIFNDNKVLFGRRRSTSVAADVYGLPGGHLEFGESFEECATREVKEETGLDIKNLELVTTTNNVISDSVQVICIFMRACLSDPNQTPQNVEPDKCEGWDWYDFRNLPEPLYEPMRAMLQNGSNPFPSHF